MGGLGAAHKITVAINDAHVRPMTSVRTLRSLPLLWILTQQDSRFVSSAFTFSVLFPLWSVVGLVQRTHHRLILLRLLERLPWFLAILVEIHRE